MAFMPRGPPMGPVAGAGVAAGAAAWAGAGAEAGAADGKAAGVGVAGRRPLREGAPGWLGMPIGLGVAGVEGYVVALCLRLREDEVAGAGDKAEAEA
jgi:hypothetical protein